MKPYRRSLLMDPFLEHAPFGTSFTTEAGESAPFPVSDFIVPGGTWGPGTGSLTTGVSSRGALSVGDITFDDFAGARFYAEIRFDAAPENAEGSGGTFDDGTGDLTGYFSSAQFVNDGASKLAGRPLVQKIAAWADQALTIYRLYDDGLGSGSTERLLVKPGLVIPGDSTWREYGCIFNPAALVTLPPGLADDRLTTGFGFKTGDFSGTYPKRLRFLINLYPQYPLLEDAIDGAGRVIPAASTHMKLVGAGMRGFAISSSQIRFGLDWSANPFRGQPSLNILPSTTAYVWHGQEQISTASPTIVSQAEVQPAGGDFICGGWSGLVSGQPVISQVPFIGALSA